MAGSDPGAGAGGAHGSPAMRVTTVIPAYDEEEALRQVVEEYRDHCDEIVIVDDGSSDGTPEIGRELADEHDDVVFVRHDENRGKAHALRTGVEHASGDILVFTDADMTYPAEHVPELVQAVEDGADLALGNRFGAGETSIPAVNRLGNRLFSFMISFVGGTRIRDGQTGMRALRREDFGALDVPASSLEFETKMTVRAAKLGHTIVEVPIAYRERVGDTKLQPVRDGWRMFRSIFVTLLTEASPMLRTAMGLSALFFLAGAYTGLVSVVNKVQTGDVQHEFYPTLTVLFVILGFQLFLTTLIGDQLRSRLDRLDEKLNRRDRD